MNNNLQSLADNLMGYCQKELGFKEPPSLFFQEDPKNAEDTLGKTAHYEPATKKVVVFVTGRHNKDILRSIAHELVHHVQNLRGEFDNDHDTSPGYAQKDSHMRNMEKEAYLLGNLLFRDWEDGLKSKRMQENKEINPVNDDIRELVKNALLEKLSKNRKGDDAEINEFISGLLGKAKSAMGMGDKEEDKGKEISEMMSKVVAAAKKLKPSGRDRFRGIGTPGFVKIGVAAPPGAHGRGEGYEAALAVHREIDAISKMIKEVDAAAYAVRGGVKTGDSYAANDAANQAYSDLINSIPSNIREDYDKVKMSVAVYENNYFPKTVVPYLKSRKPKSGTQYGLRDPSDGATSFNEAHILNQEMDISEEKDEDYFRTPLDQDEKLKGDIDKKIKAGLKSVKKPARPPMKEEEELEEGEQQKSEKQKKDRERNEEDARISAMYYGSPYHPNDPRSGIKEKKEVHNMNIDTIKEMIKEKLLEALKSEGKMPMGPGPDGKEGTKDDRPAFVDQNKPEEEGNIENMPPQLRAAAKKKQKQNEEQEIFAPNHYCVHHGGVQHNGSVQMAEAVSHNYNKELGRVTHYDMKLEDGTILEGVAAEDIQVTNASLANEHMHAVRDDDEEKKKMQEEDLEERVSKHDKQEYQGMPRSAYEAEYMRRKEEEEKEKKGKLKEGKIQTPEQEKLLYESRFTGRDTDLFNRLLNKWIK